MRIGLTNFLTPPSTVRLAAPCAPQRAGEGGDGRVAAKQALGLNACSTGKVARTFIGVSP
jgi:hypothetical protein